MQRLYHLRQEGQTHSGQQTRKCILQAEKFMPGRKKLGEELFFPKTNCSPASFSMPGINLPAYRNIYSDCLTCFIKGPKITNTIIFYSQKRYIICILFRFDFDQVNDVCITLNIVCEQRYQLNTGLMFDDFFCGIFQKR